MACCDCLGDYAERKELHVARLLKETQGQLKALMGKVEPARR